MCGLLLLLPAICCCFFLFFFFYIWFRCLSRRCFGGFGTWWNFRASSSLSSGWLNCWVWERVPPLCAVCAPYLLYLALPRVSISLHLGISPCVVVGLCFPLFVLCLEFLLYFIMFYSVLFSSIPSINMSISASVPVFGISSSLLWTIPTVAPFPPLHLLLVSASLAHLVFSFLWVLCCRVISRLIFRHA